MPNLLSTRRGNYYTVLILTLIYFIIKLSSHIDYSAASEIYLKHIKPQLTLTLSTSFYNLGTLIACALAYKLLETESILKSIIFGCAFMALMSGTLSLTIIFLFSPDIVLFMII